MDIKAAGILAGGLVGAALILGVMRGSPAPATRGPIAAGDLVRVSVWKNPLTSSSNEGGTYEGGRVAIYDGFILITHADGDQTLSLHGYYSNLRFKPDRR